MSLKIGDLVNQISGKIISDESPILDNPIIVSAIIVVIIIFISYIVMRDEVETTYDDTTIFHLLMKAGIWGFMSTGLLLFLHNRVISDKYENKYKNLATEELANAVIQRPDATEAIKPDILNTPISNIPNTAT